MRMRNRGGIGRECERGRGECDRGAGVRGDGGTGGVRRDGGSVRGGGDSGV